MRTVSLVIGLASPLLSLALMGCAASQQVGPGSISVDRPAARAEAGLGGPGVKPKRIASGEGHACAVDDHGRVLCWGDNGYGQTGPRRDRRSRPRPIEGVGKAVEVAVGATFSCARLATGRVACWGQVPSASCGPSCLVEMEGVSDAVGLSAGPTSVCAVRRSGKVQCWESGMYGREGRSYAPAKLDDAVSVAVGGAHACALRESGRVACWGQNESGQLGASGSWSHAAPVTVEHLGDAVYVASSADRSCAIRRGGEVVCWGAAGADPEQAMRVTPAHFGPAPWLEAEADGKSSPAAAPRRVEALTGSIRLAVFSSGVCGVRTDGSVRCDGSSDIGGSAARLTSIEQLAVSPTGMEACATDRSSAVSCWGRAQGETESLVWPPARVGEIKGSLDLAATGTYACALGQGGRVDCWGVYPGAFDMDESAMPEAYTNPARVARLTSLPADTRSLAATRTTVCGVRANGRIACADPAMTAYQATPGVVGAVTLSPSLTGATGIHAGSGMFCATLGTGGAQCWYALSSVARKFDDAKDLTLEPAEVEDPCIVRSTGSVECWTTMEFLDTRKPGKVMSGVSDAIGVSGGGALACALERSGDVLCWDAGRPDANEYERVRVADARSITGFHHGVCATTVAGGVVCHGLDSSGHLERKASVVFERGVRKVVSGGSYLCALHDDGRVSCWGDNSSGQCGVSPSASHGPRKILTLSDA